MTGTDLITIERHRQIDEELWSLEHDDLNTDSQLVKAAVCYLTLDNKGWPWDKSWWKPTDKIRNLVKAGALIAAEIDRLQRIK